MSAGSFCLRYHTTAYGGMRSYVFVYVSLFCTNVSYGTYSCIHITADSVSTYVGIRSYTVVFHGIRFYAVAYDRIRFLSSNKRSVWNICVFMIVLRRTGSPLVPMVCVGTSVAPDGSRNQLTATASAVAIAVDFRRGNIFTPIV
ncbi:hypothetical protein SAMN02910406_00284 [Ruminococcus albus]|uniref:Uncharacterized protein n=1 Tax=Ruminococcus albus TaxID=1264 RepID=A0A1I1D862_RUMAL|nr:hypothetical protein SAMN02910406_00284 [Ruminococcus albus]